MNNLNRKQEYRYRYFTERSQDDGFDVDSVPVYRDVTVSLRINENGEDLAANMANNIDHIDHVDASSTTNLTQKREVIA